MATRSVPGFLPSTSGFRFANDFPPAPVRYIGIPGVISIPIGDASNGLCGGMVFAARDYLEKKRPAPSGECTQRIPCAVRPSGLRHRMCGGPLTSPRLAFASGRGGFVEAQRSADGGEPG
jgi:hypothetical protein